LALAAVFVEGLIFIALTLTKVRSAIIHAIPLSQKYAIGAGIGLFLTIIGMQEAGFVVDSPATLITFGAQNVAKPEFWLALFGLFLAAVLISRGIKGALLISILTTTVIGIALGIHMDWSHKFEAWEDSFRAGAGKNTSFAIEDLPTQA
jgi:AGZA family xanthine/uracil permease-like MFS transporter